MVRASSEMRVRRPKEHELLIQHLRDEGGFATMRDILLFAAGVGLSAERRIPFIEAGEPIRYETITDPVHAEAFINMIAAVEQPNDPEVLDTARLEERVRIFEEYANGGLGFLQEQLNTRRQPIDVVVGSLVVEALDSSEGSVEPADLGDLLKGFI